MNYTGNLSHKWSGSGNTIFFFNMLNHISFVHAVLSQHALHAFCACWEMHNYQILIVIAGNHT